MEVSIDYWLQEDSNTIREKSWMYYVFAGGEDD